MKVPRNIMIRLNGFNIETLMDLFAQKSATDWKITAGLEKYLAVPDRNLFCSKCGNDNDLSGAKLSLYLTDPHTLCVQNVIAYENNQSSCYRCNRILEGFFEKVVRPSIQGLDLAAELTREEISLRDVAGPELAALLSKFSKLANKATGSCHPCDRKTWCDFILAAHSNGTPINTDLLINTLEEEGWPPESAQMLGAEFEFGMTLLCYSEDRGRSGGTVV